MQRIGAIYQIVYKNDKKLFLCPCYNSKPTIMPIENITTKVHWTSNKTIDQTLIKTKQAKYDATSFESNTSFQFKQRVKKVAIIGAGPAGVCISMQY